MVRDGSAVKRTDDEDIGNARRATDIDDDINGAGRTVACRVKSYDGEGMVPIAVPGGIHTPLPAVSAACIGKLEDAVYVELDFRNARASITCPGVYDGAGDSYPINKRSGTCSLVVGRREGGTLRGSKDRRGSTDNNKNTGCY